MDCLNQFQFYIAQGLNFTTASNTFSVFGTAPNLAWTCGKNLPTNNFTVQGFKNINLYGIKLLSGIRNGITNSDQGIVEDYNFSIGFTGQIPSISGEYNPNGLSINPNVGEVYLGKFNNELRFTDPIKSCSNISIAGFTAQGHTPQSLTSLTLDIIVQIIFYYKYEGEDETFALL